MKKIVSILLAAAVCIGSVSVSAHEYGDIDAAAPYANAVGRLYDFGVMRGYEDGTFRPERVVTRAEAAALMCAAKNIHAEDIVFDWEILELPDDYEKSEFSDVPKTHWAYRFITYAAQMAPAPVQGYEDGTFRPDETVTCQEFIKMCVSLIGYWDEAEKNGGYPHGYMTQAAQLGLTMGAGAITNDHGITRADAAVILANTLETPIMAVAGLQVDEDGRVTEISKVMDGVGEDYKNLLTMYFNIFKVTASVADTDNIPPVEISGGAYDRAVENLRDFNIIGGDFDPDSEITKGEFAKYARRLMYQSDDEIKTRYRDTLTDVPDDRNDIFLMLSRGYMKPKHIDGEPMDTEFGTDDKITYGEAAQTLLYMLGFNYDILDDCAGQAIVQGIVKDIENIGYKRVIDTVTGRELAVMLYNCLDKPTGTNISSDDNTFRNKLNGSGGVYRVEDKGEKVAEFKDVTIPVMGDSSNPDSMAKVCTVKIPEDKVIIISLDDDTPTHVDYFAGVAYGRGASVITGLRMPGDIIVLPGTIEDEYDIYLAASSAPVTVSGSVYVKDYI